jgi:hypothetical protein
VVIIGGVAVYLRYVKGWSLGDFMYVTKASLQNFRETMQEGKHRLWHYHANSKCVDPAFTLEGLSTWSLLLLSLCAGLNATYSLKCGLVSL